LSQSARWLKDSAEIAHNIMNPQGPQLKGSESTQFKKGFTPWNKGLSGYKTKPCSEERKIKIGLANSKKRRTEAEKENNRIKHLGIKQSQETIAKRIANPNMKGEGHYKWIKDRTIISSQQRDRRVVIWAKNVKERDGYKCRIGNCDCSDVLEAHHILRWRDYPELRYEINNGITLCSFHHPRKREDEDKLVGTYQEIINQLKQNHES